MMQSLLPALYPMLKSSYRLSFTQIGHAHLHLSVHRIAAAAAGGDVRRQEPPALFARCGHGLHAGGPAAARLRRQLRAAARRRGARRHRLLGVSSGILARGAHGLGRQARAGAVGVPGRRQPRLLRRPAARRLHRAAARSVERGVVLRRGAARHGGALQRRALVQGARHRAPGTRAGAGRRARGAVMSPPR